MSRPIWISIAVLVATALLGVLPAAAGAATPPYAPVDQPGPPLGVPEPALASSLACTGDVQAGASPAVLLVPGTTMTPAENYSWNYEPALSAAGVPWCAVTLPENAMGDIQVAAEYVVHAIRAMHAITGQRIDVIGHSQGGMVPRWALRFWPDTRPMVDDLVGLAPSNHGTALNTCLTSCAPALWQQRDNSAFVDALNSYQETFAGISYTNVYTHLDEAAIPNLDDTGTSSLHGGDGLITNVAVQDICAADVSEHLATGTYDPVSYRLVADALTHAGPAQPQRVGPDVCTELLMPGVNPVTFAADYLALTTNLATRTATTPGVPAEPPLRCYVTASRGQ